MHVGTASSSARLPHLGDVTATFYHLDLLTVPPSKNENTFFGFGYGLGTEKWEGSRFGGV